MTREGKLRRMSARLSIEIRGGSVASYRRPDLCVKRLTISLSEDPCLILQRGEIMTYNLPQQPFLIQLPRQRLSVNRKGKSALRYSQDPCIDLQLGTAKRHRESWKARPFAVAGGVGETLRVERFAFPLLKNLALVGYGHLRYEMLP